ncbi:MAG: hypothetical protein DME26_22515 [Verrucomicrobia bacterium]|nr:MAG: hypothetical protein DME26_22515 [Verrucomicrobiota bacterium]
MNATKQSRLRKYWSDRESRFDAPEQIKPDGLFDAPEFLVRLIGRQNAELLELLSAKTTVRSRRI